MSIRSKITLTLATAAAIVLVPASASAHVTVKPVEANVAAYQTFTVSVPNEKDNLTTAVRLLVPEGVNNATPTVKPGWEINTQKTGDRVIEISWTGGAIPVGQRDDFTFSAQVPEKESTIQWKAYQTYENGTTVAWDQAPTAEHGEEGGDKGPYSETKIINDLKADGVADATETLASSGNVTGAYALAGVALAVALISLTIKRRN